MDGLGRDSGPPQPCVSAGKRLETTRRIGRLSVSQLAGPRAVCGVHQPARAPALGVSLCVFYVAFFLPPSALPEFLVLRGAVPEPRCTPQRRSARTQVAPSHLDPRTGHEAAPSPHRREDDHGIPFIIGSIGFILFVGCAGRCCPSAPSCAALENPSSRGNWRTAHRTGVRGRGPDHDVPRRPG